MLLHYYCHKTSLRGIVPTSTKFPIQSPPCVVIDYRAKWQLLEYHRHYYWCWSLIWTRQATLTSVNCRWNYRLIGACLVALPGLYRPERPAWSSTTDHCPCTTQRALTSELCKCITKLPQRQRWRWWIEFKAMGGTTENSNGSGGEPNDPNHWLL